MNCKICSQPIAADGYYVDVHKLPADLAPYPAHWPHCPYDLTERAAKYKAALSDVTEGLISE